MWTHTPILTLLLFYSYHSVHFPVPGAQYIYKKRNGKHPKEYYNTAVQSQKAVSAYFTSKQILPFGFAEQNSRAYFLPWSRNVCLHSLGGRESNTERNYI